MIEAHRSEAKRCTGTRRDGTPCAATVMGAGTLCYAHDPARATERDQARRKGGTNSATRARLDRLVPATLRPMIGSLLEALGEFARPVRRLIGRAPKRQRVLADREADHAAHHFCSAWA